MTGTQSWVSCALSFLAYSVGCFFTYCLLCIFARASIFPPSQHAIERRRRNSPLHAANSPPSQPAKPRVGRIAALTALSAHHSTPISKAERREQPQPPKFLSPPYLLPTRKSTFASTSSMVPCGSCSPRRRARRCAKGTTSASSTKLGKKYALGNPRTQSDTDRTSEVRI